MEWVRQAILIYEETDFILEELLVQIMNLLLEVGRFNYVPTSASLYICGT